MKPDDVCELYSEKSVALTLRLLDDNNDNPMVLIEGTAETLKMFAELLLAVSKSSAGSGFSISPKGAGSFHFSKVSKLGMYINKIETQDSQS